MTPDRMGAGSIALTLAFLWLNPAQAAIPPESWEDYTLRGVPIACEIPSGWKSQEFSGGQTNPVPLDDRREGWDLQEVYWEGQGYSRVLIHLRHAHLILEYFDGKSYPSPSFESMDRHIKSQLRGDRWGSDETGSWKGMRTLLTGRLETTGHKSVHYYIELSGSEYLHLYLQSTAPGAGTGFESYLPLFGHMKKSIRLVTSGKVRKDPAPHREFGRHYVTEGTPKAKGGVGKGLPLKGSSGRTGSGRVVGDDCTPADRDKAELLRQAKGADGKPLLGPDEDYLCDKFEREKAEALKSLKKSERR